MILPLLFPVLPVVREGSSSARVKPLTVHPISIVVPPGGARPISAEEDEGNKDGMISDVRRMQAKIKAIMAMGKAVTGAPNVAKRVPIRRTFTRLLDSKSLTRAAIVVIPDDDVRQSEGIGGTLKQTVVPTQVITLTPAISSPPKDSGDV